MVTLRKKRRKIFWCVILIWEIICLLNIVSWNTILPERWQEWANDQVENEMEIVLDAVSKLRSLRPPTDIHERCVYVHPICSSMHTMTDAMLKCTKIAIYFSLDSWILLVSSR